MAAECRQTSQRHYQNRGDAGAVLQSGRKTHECLLIGLDAKKIGPDRRKPAKAQISRALREGFPGPLTVLEMIDFE
jgi:hypothetical protein